MFFEESLWIKEQLEGLDLKPGEKVLDVGSSTAYFRTIQQPHIEVNVFAPLRARGLRVYHLDAKTGEGIDIQCDVTALYTLSEKYRLVICTHLLEHVANPRRVARDVFGRVEFGGYLLLTTPRRYKYHEDPVDTMYRPHWKALLRLLVPAGAESVSGCTLSMKERSKYSRREIWRLLLRKWQVSCLLVRKPDNS
jgi:2-polyprenyl-3-methyl-5-hydroxy-6-metoxy-1,4-benzoquinol methylase